MRHRGDEVVLQTVELALLRDVAQRPDPAEKPAAIVEDGSGEALEDPPTDLVLELVEGRLVRVRPELLHRMPVLLGVGDAIRHREQAVDDGPFEAHAELARQRDERPVRELHVAVGVREQDAVDRRVEHGPQDVGEALEVVVLRCELTLMPGERARHLVEGGRQLPHLADAALLDLDPESSGGDLPGRGRDAANRRDRCAQEIADDAPEEQDRHEDPGNPDLDSGPFSVGDALPLARRKLVLALQLGVDERANRIDLSLAALRLDARGGALPRGPGLPDERDRPLREVVVPRLRDVLRPRPRREAFQQARLGRELPLRPAPGLEEGRVAGDHVAARAGLEVENELLDLRARHDRPLGPLLGAGGVSDGLEGVDDKHELDHEEDDDDPSGDQDPRGEAQAHGQILSRTWPS